MCCLATCCFLDMADFLVWAFVVSLSDHQLRNWSDYCLWLSTWNDTHRSQTLSIARRFRHEIVPALGRHICMDNSTFVFLYCSLVSVFRGYWAFRRNWTCRSKYSAKHLNAFFVIVNSFATTGISLVSNLIGAKQMSYVMHVCRRIV